MAEHRSYEAFHELLWGEAGQRQIGLEAMFLRERLQRLLTPVLEDEYNQELCDRLSPELLECCQLLIHANRADKAMGIKSRKDYTDENLRPYSTIIGIRGALEDVWRGSEMLLMQRVLSNEPQVKVSSDYLEILANLQGSLAKISRYLPLTKGLWGSMLTPVFRVTGAFNLADEVHNVKITLEDLERGEIRTSKIDGIAAYASQISAGANFIPDIKKLSPSQIAESIAKLQLLMQDSTERVKLFRQLYLIGRLSQKLRPIEGYRVDLDDQDRLSDNLDYLAPPATLEEAIDRIMLENPEIVARGGKEAAKELADLAIVEVERGKANPKSVNEV